MTSDLFAGFVDLEGTLVGSVLVVNSSGTPINSDATPTFRVYGPDGFVESGSTSFRDSGSITNATNASPIVITSADHGLTTGARVTITGVTGNSAANGTFIITKVDASSFSLNGSTGDGAYSSGGTWNATGLYQYSITIAGVDGYEKGEVYQIAFNYEISSTAGGILHTFNVS